MVDTKIEAKMDVKKEGDNVEYWVSYKEEGFETWISTKFMSNREAESYMRKFKEKK